jgi:nickel-dependent lactate racemase
MYSIPFDKSQITFELPPGLRGTVVKSRRVPPLADVAAGIQGALAQPVGSPPLRELAVPGDKVCIIFTDITRATPDHLLVPSLLTELEMAGVRSQDVTLLCGTGMHRPSTPAEKVTKLSQAVVDRYRVVDHEPQNPAALVDLGTTESGIPISVNRLVYEADLAIATGIVEPHHLAGYSGGRKTLAVGAGGEAMIAATHGPQMVDHPGTRLGRIERNPFHEALTEAAKRAGLRFILNVVSDDDKRIVAVRAGEPTETLLELVAIAKNLYEVPIPHQYDLAVAGVGFPKAHPPPVRPGRGWRRFPQGPEPVSGFSCGQLSVLRADTRGQARRLYHPARALPGRGRSGSGRAKILRHDEARG